MPTRNRRWVLASRPNGKVEASNFKLVEGEVPALREGQVLVEVHFLSLDPYMRGRMDDARSYAPSQPIGEVMIGGTVGAVLESRNPRFSAGDLVVGMGGWQEIQVTGGADLRVVRGAAVPESLHLGALGMPGITAWYGLTQIGKPKPGETVVVSSAAGAVGSVVGQLARAAGCRAVGIAGGARKCDAVVRELGFDACVDYRSADFRTALKAATPAGVDVLFENVGGAVMDAALARMNPFGRVALCGLIAGYDGEELALRNVRAILVSRLLVQGFIVSEHLELWPEALAVLGKLHAGGKLGYHETIAEGIESAPDAFMGMLRGTNLGKQLVRVK